jgi:hypothetical protein
MAFECRLICGKADEKRIKQSGLGLQKAERKLVRLPTEVVGATIFLIAIWALFLTNVMIISKT